MTGLPVAVARRAIPANPADFDTMREPVALDAPRVPLDHDDPELERIMARRSKASPA